VKARDVKASSGDLLATRVRLPLSRLLVHATYVSGGVRLDVSSLVDPRHTFLLPVPASPALDGLSLASRLGHMYAVEWGVVYGSGRLPPDALVTFSTGTLRFRRTVSVAPLRLAEDCWLAEAEGLFTTAAVVVDGVETARTALMDRWPA
jgi:hypothetical protein